VGDQTGIQWTDATWNPVVGCTKVSEGCRNCYIERTPPFRVAGMRFEGPAGPGEPGATTGVLLHPDRLDQPIRWRRPRRVFVNSLSDLFHQEVPSAFIVKVFATMALADHHIFQVLTKRPARMRALISNPAFEREVRRQIVLSPTPRLQVGWPLANVWLGVSVEAQDVTWRIPLLRRTPAALRFLSCEPLLGPVSLIGDDRGWLRPGGIDWIIGGGESGPDARPMHPVWLRLLVDQAAAAEVAMFVKQFGGWRPASVDADDLEVLEATRSLDASGAWADGVGATTAEMVWSGSREHNGDPDAPWWPTWAKVRQFPEVVVAA
jgi:protein gp37